MLNTILLQASPAPAGGGGMSMLLMMVALFAIMYFLMIAPQRKKQKKVNEFRNSLQKGDKVMTAGGIYGRIREVKDDHVLLEIDNNVTIKIDKNSIYQSMEDVVAK
jgi:preprotein translocase subunit YajC